MTVSRTVNGSGPVSEAVRKRVLQAIEELGYVPSRVARGLRSNRTHTIALIVTDVTNPFFTTIARGVEDAASDRDHLLLLCNSDESEAEELRYLDLLAGQGVDGILFVPARTGKAARELAHRRRLPLVILDRRVDSDEYSVVRCDSKAGAADMARYLLEQGHRDIVLLAGPEGVPTSDDRVAGFREALIINKDARVRVLHGQFCSDWGREGVGRALALDPPPTALFALNNFVTIGALQALWERGVHVPDDVTLVGFDDLPAAMVSQPFLTVISQPAYEMGRRAVDLLLDQLDDPEQSPQEIVLPSELTIRSSSGPVR